MTTTTFEDDIRLALRQRAATHEVVVPPIDDLVAAPYASGGPAVPRRRVVAGIAAALLATAVGASAVVLSGGDDPDRPVATTTAPPPPAGTHGAILTGFGPPVDGSEMSWDLPPDVSVPDPDAAGPIVVLRAADGDGEPLAVVALASDTGISSFDVYAPEDATPGTVAGWPALEHDLSPVLPHLTTVLEVDRGDGQRLFAAGLGIDRSEVVALAQAALSASDPLEPWWPDGYAAIYAGADRNPFRGVSGDERRLGYARDGRAATVIFRTETGDPADFAWYVDGSVSLDAEGRRVVLWSGDGRDEGGPVAAWAEAGGTVSVAADEADLDQAIAAVRVVDAATWAAERAAATDPGSRFSSDTTEAASPPTTG